MRCHWPHICMPCMANVVPDASWNVVNAGPAAQHGKWRTARCIQISRGPASRPCALLAHPQAMAEPRWRLLPGHLWTLVFGCLDLGERCATASARQEMRWSMATVWH